MDEDEEEGEAHGGADGVRVGYAPGDAGEEHEEREEIGERWVGAVPGIFCFYDARLGRRGGIRLGRRECTFLEGC